MTILCDIDGVLADMCSEWLRRYNRDYHDNLTFDRVTQWEMAGLVKPECGKAIYQYLHDADLYDNVEQHAGALDGVATLRAMDHDIVYLSSSPGGNMMKSKMDWLDRHGFLDLGSVIMVNQHKDKGLISGCVMIDDYPENLRASKAAHNILFDAPYNRDADIGQRAHGWEGVIGHFKVLVR